MQKRIFLMAASFFFISLLVQSQVVGTVSTVVPDFEGNGSVAVSADGTLFINEYGTANSNISGTGKRVFKVTSDGQFEVLLDEVSGAVGNAVDSKGNYYFNNGNSYESSTLMSYTAEGELLTIAELKGFSGDILISKDEESFFIPSYTRPVIMKVNKNGETEEFVKDTRLLGCTGIVRGESNEMYVSNFASGLIMAVSESGELEEIGNIPVVYPNYVVGYITYFEGHIYATGYGSNKIYKMSLEGQVSELAGSGKYGSTDGEAKDAEFITPNGIEVDPKKRLLYVTQNGNGKPAALRAIKL